MSQAGLGLGRVIVQAPLQLTVKVPVPAVAGMEMLSGIKVMAAALGALTVTETVLLLPFTVTVPPAADDAAVTLTVPLLLPLVGVTVYPVVALTVQATFDEMLMVPDAPPARVKVVGDTLKTP